MKTKRFIILTFIFICINTTSIFANNISTIRVGLESLYKNVTSSLITNDSINIGYSYNNVFISGANIKAESSFFIKSPKTFFVKLEQTYTSYDNASSVLASLGQDNAVIAYVDDNIWAIALNYQTLAEATSASGMYNNATVISFAGKNSILYDGNKMKVIFVSKDKNFAFKGNNEHISVGARVYRGYLEVFHSSDEKFTLVNVVPFEEYLYAVVPSEMPSNWNIEALKAQAVSARTYAMTQMNKHTTTGYNLCDKEDCQVYLGVTNESTNTTNAVNQTSGQAVYYNDKLIETLYSSSSGGVTANSEDVWVTKLPYLREKVDPYDKEGLVWTRSVTVDELSSMLLNKGENIGVPTSITIDEYSENGRINKLTIVGTNGKYSLTKENIRYFFSYNSLPSLPSRFFTISSSTTNNNNSSSNNKPSLEVYVTNGSSTSKIDLKNATILTGNGNSVLSLDNVTIKGVNSTSSYDLEGTTTTIPPKTEVVTGNQFLFSGKGFGHGVGMSQYGAKGMAEAGFNYKEILQYYYTGVDIY